MHFQSRIVCSGCLDRRQVHAGSSTLHSIRLRKDRALLWRRAHKCVSLCWVFKSKNNFPKIASEQSFNRSGRFFSNQMLFIWCLHLSKTLLIRFWVWFVKCHTSRQGWKHYKAYIQEHCHENKIVWSADSCRLPQHSHTFPLPYLRLLDCFYKLSPRTISAIKRRPCVSCAPTSCTQISAL